MGVTLGDAQRVLDGVGTHGDTTLEHPTLQLDCVNGEILCHPSFKGLKHLILHPYSPLQEPISSPNPAATHFPFSLQTLRLDAPLQYLFVPETWLQVLEALVPTVATATSLSITMTGGGTGTRDYHTNELGDASARIVARLLRSASRSVEVLSLIVAPSEELHTALASLEVLEVFYDNDGDGRALGLPRILDQTDPRLVALPDSLERYFVGGLDGWNKNSTDARVSLFQELGEALRDDHTMLPNLKEVGCGWLMGSDHWQTGSSRRGRLGSCGERCS